MLEITDEAQVRKQLNFMNQQNKMNFVATKELVHNI